MDLATGRENCVWMDRQLNSSPIADTHPLLHCRRQMLETVFSNPSVLLLLGLAYAYVVLEKIFRHGSTLVRLVSVVPTVYFFFIIPWSFSSALIRGFLSYFITWISSFKLISFCFQNGPLVPCSSSFIHFSTITIFPIKAKGQTSEKNDAAISQSLTGLESLSSVAPLIWLGTVLNLYIFVIEKGTSNQLKLLSFYMIVIFSWFSLARFVSQYEVVRIFDRPYLSTSLRDFWGKRWNKYSSYMLRLTVYDPTRNFLSRYGIKAAPARVAATLITLSVSGIMHELMFYYITCGKQPTWEASRYFVLQGLSMACESLFKYLWLQVFKCDPISPDFSAVFVVGFVSSSFYWFVVVPVSHSGQNQC